MGHRLIVPVTLTLLMFVGIMIQSLLDVIFLINLTNQSDGKRLDVLKHLILVQSICLFALIICGIPGSVLLLIGFKMGRKWLILSSLSLFYTAYLILGFFLTYQIQVREIEMIPLYFGKEPEYLVSSILLISGHASMNWGFHCFLVYFWKEKMVGLGNVEKFKGKWKVMKSLFIFYGVVTILLFIPKFVVMLLNYVSLEESPQKKQLLLTGGIFFALCMIFISLMTNELCRKLDYGRLRRFLKYYITLIFTFPILNPIRDGLFGESGTLWVANITRLLDIPIWIFFLSAYTIVFIMKKTKEDPLKGSEEKRAWKKGITPLKPENIQVLECTPIGKGQFSQVYKGLYNRPQFYGKHLIKPSFSVQVAVKVMAHGDHEREIPSGVLIEEIQNLERVMRLKKGKERFVKLYGTCLLDKGSAENANPGLGRVNIIMEFCTNGTLLETLHKISDKYDDGSSEQKRGEIMQYHWGLEVADGMRHLAKLKIVHGDLAARNILLGSEMEAKISDFGMSCKLYGYQTYARTQNTIFPWRWMAPESLDILKFSRESDTWSYGVLLWEIFSLGQIPYEDFEWCSTFTTNLENGQRLPKPCCATEEEYELMKDCWKFSPQERPNFEAIYNALKSLGNIP